MFWEQRLSTIGRGNWAEIQDLGAAVGHDVAEELDLAGWRLSVRAGWRGASGGEPRRGAARGEPRRGWRRSRRDAAGGDPGEARLEESVARLEDIPGETRVEEIPGEARPEESPAAGDLGRDRCALF